MNEILLLSAAVELVSFSDDPAKWVKH